MVIIIIFLFSIYCSQKKSSLQYLLIYHYLVSVLLFCFAYQGIDVTYKIDLSLPSDTYLYYSAYVSEWTKIADQIFPIYPYFLRIIEYPFHNALFAVWGQCVLTFFLLDIIIKQKKNLLFYVFFHALIYTNVNMFKDNIIIIVGLLSYIILNKTKSSLLQSGIIAGAVGLVAAVRPFMEMFFPIAILPLWVNIKNKSIKRNLFIIGCLSFVVIFVAMQDYISGIQNTFSDDSSVQAERSSPPIALIKVLLGPTPLHYLFHEQYMQQPFLDSHTFVYTLLHIIYYVIFAFWAIYIYSNWRVICNIYTMSISRVFILSFAMIQMIVYIMIYGSADIRQRAIIISFLYIFTLIDNKIVIIRRMQHNKFLIFAIVICCLSILTFIN